MRKKNEGFFGATNDEDLRTPWERLKAARAKLAGHLQARGLEEAWALVGAMYDGAPMDDEPESLIVVLELVAQKCGVSPWELFKVFILHSRIEELKREVSLEDLSNDGWEFPEGGEA
jgi:hypothetical protein